MKPRRKVPRRRPVRKARIPRAVRPGTRIQQKVYSYQFKKDSFYLRNTGSGALTLQPAGAPPVGWAIGTIATSASGLSGYYDIANSATFCINDLTNIGTFLNMYDAYKLTGIKATFTFLQNSSLLGNLGVNPTINIVTDMDDSLLPTSQAQISGKQCTRRFTFGNTSRTKFSMFFRPNTKIALSSISNTPASVSASAINPSLQWIDSTMVVMMVVMRD